MKNLAGPDIPPRKRFGFFRRAVPANRNLLKKVLIGAAIVLVVFAIVGFFVVPPVAKHYLVKGMSEALGRNVTVESVRLNPFTLVAVVRGLDIAEADGSTRFLGFDELSVDLQAQSLLRLAPIVREVTLKMPYVHLVRNADGKTYNFSDIIDRFAAAPKAKEPSEPARFSVNNIRVSDGLVEIEDQPKQARHSVSDISIAIPFLSNVAYSLDDYVEPSFAAKFNGTPVALQGRTRPFQDAMEASLDIDIYKLDISRYMEYLPEDAGFRVTSGSLDAQLTLTFVRPVDRDANLWLKGDIALNRLAVTEKDGKPLLNLARLSVPIAGINVLGGQYKFDPIKLEKPEVFVRRNRDGSLNWVAALPGRSQKPSPQPADEPAASIELMLPELAIRDGAVHFSDLVPEPGFRTDLTNIQAALRDFALPQEQPASIDVSFDTRFGESVKHASSLTLEPLSSTGTLEARKVRLTRYSSYYHDLLAYQLEDGTVDVATRYAVTVEGEKLDARLDGFNLSLASARLRKPGADADLLSIKSVQVRNLAMDLGKRTVNVAEFTTSEGMIDVVREKDGGINVARIMTAREASETGGETSGAAAPDAAWQFNVARADLQKWQVAFTDLVPADPVRIVADELSIQGRDLGNQPDHKGQLALEARLNRTGSLSVKGPVSIAPPSAGLQVNLQKFSVVALQPWFADRLNILLTSADVSVAGNARVALGDAGQPDIGFEGDVTVARFASVDKPTSADFLKWETLQIDKIAYTHEPMRLDIGQVALSDFYSRIIIHPDGHLNLQDIMVAEPAAPAAEPAAEGEAPTPAPEQPAQAAQPTSPPPPIRIGAVTLQNGDVNFTDLFIKPNYSANLSAIGGAVTGLSSQLDTAADVDLRGRFAVTAPVQIKGKVNPLVQNLFLDIKADVRDIELGPFTPYSGKYVGYAIEKGKMSFDVSYRIQDRKLEASNRITVDQLTFGGKIESPEATKLPVLLAVALLKDRNGVIDVNLPISGSLDDPKFSVGGLIVRVIVNLITKAITSPFALLGSLVGGGGEELSYVEFDPGLATLSAAAEEKIAALKKGLVDRPGLRLDVMPLADPEADRETARRLAFERQVKAEKLQDLVKKGSEIKSVDEVDLAPEEYEKYLRRAYKEADIPKPRNALGFVKDLPVEETEKLMLTHTQVTDDDLLKLANQRAQAVKDALTRDGEVAPERVFLVAPKLQARDADDKRLGSRVDFSLK